ncbi:phage portal protein family protein [Elizabethkingia anophelis]|uniref:phage portal protein family protein n=1 Tax=Elizabethkingia anophelis TaxID=1117645 RepID=UPI003891B29D
MAKKNDNPIKTQEPVIIQDLTLISPDRNRKDVQNLKNAVISAEQVYFPNRVLLYDLYHDVVSLDGFLKGIIEKRIKSVLNKKLNFIDKSGKENKEITKLIRGKAGRKLIRKIIESELWGISGVEFKIGEKFCFEEIPRKHIKPEKGLITKSQYGQTADGGYKIEDLPFVWVIGEKNNLGLLLSCALYAIYKRGNFGDWAQFVEIFGQPVRIMYYDAYDTKTKEELRKVLRDSGNSLAMMLPKQASFEMKDGKQTNGDGKLQETFKRACNEEMAIAILGNTETTSSSKSSGYAQSKEHAEQQEEIIAADLTLIENELNSDHFLNILKSYGYDVDGGEFKYELEQNLAKLKIRLEIDKEVSKMVPIADDYWYDTYGIPKPDNYDELKKEMQEKEERMLTIMQNQNPGVTSKEPEAKEQETSDDEKENLADLAKPKLLDIFFKRLADFFDQARH